MARESSSFIPGLASSAITLQEHSASTRTDTVPKLLTVSCVHLHNPYQSFIHSNIYNVKQLLCLPISFRGFLALAMSQVLLSPLMQTSAQEPKKNI